MDESAQARKMRLPSGYDLHLFAEGTHTRAYEFLGSSFERDDEGREGVRFAVWAPNAKSVGVACDANGWDGNSDPLKRLFSEDGSFSGIWCGFKRGMWEGARYKYRIDWECGSHLKSDPMAFSSEMRPATASLAVDRSKVLSGPPVRLATPSVPYYKRPMNIYEVHLGTWMRRHDGSFMSYEELCGRLPQYVKDMCYTHVEFMPLNEHPLDQSWGYQATGLYSPTSRHGSPEGLKKLIGALHSLGIGAILDWVPAHFCKDAHGLMNFDGSPLYGKVEHPDWGTMEFDLSQGQVRSFLISNALYWIKEFGFDGLRIDAVASMLYLDYSRKPGQWTPNREGGRENLDAVEFLRQLNRSVAAETPDALVIAEESTAWPKVSWPVSDGGLGFSYKWNMGWMNDFLKYMGEDPIHRRHHHNLVTFAMWYHYSEKFILPLSHDEVVHGKGSLIGRMPGDYWQKFANLRAAMAFMMSHPGKKLLFMGGEFAQFIEWRDWQELDRSVLAFEQHRRHMEYIRRLNTAYAAEGAFWELDSYEHGFSWIDANNSAQSVLAFARRAGDGGYIVCLHNFTPVAYDSYRVGVHEPGTYEELLNSDDAQYGGSGVTNPSDLHSQEIASHGLPRSLCLRIPPLGSCFIKLKSRVV